MSDKTGYDQTDPPHYRRGGMESADVIEAFELDWHLGSAVSYLLRCFHKPDTDPVKDLLKARWFIDRKLKQLGYAPSLFGGSSRIGPGPVAEGDIVD